MAAPSLMGPNQWPDAPAGFREAYRYYEAVLACGADVLRAVAVGLDLPETFFADRYRHPIAADRSSTTPTAARFGGDSVRRRRAYGLRLPNPSLAGRGRRSPGTEPGRRVDRGPADRTSYVVSGTCWHAGPTTVGVDPHRVVNSSGGSGTPSRSSTIRTPRPLSIQRTSACRRAKIRSTRRSLRGSISRPASTLRSPIVRNPTNRRDELRFGAASVSDQSVDRERFQVVLDEQRAGLIGGWRMPST